MSLPPTFNDIRFVAAPYTAQLPGRNINTKVVLPSQDSVSLFSNGIGIRCTTLCNTSGLPPYMYEHAFRMDPDNFELSRFMIAIVDVQRDPVTGKLMVLPNKKLMGEFMATNGGSYDGSDCINKGLAYINDIPPTVLASVLSSERLSAASIQPTREFDCVKPSLGNVIPFPISAWKKDKLGRTSVILNGPAPSG